MTQRLNGLDSLTQQTQVEIFDSTGHIDGVATEECIKQVLHEANTVKVGGVVDTVATLAKRKAAKAVFLASRNN